MPKHSLASLKQAKPGDKVKVVCQNTSYIGILLPRPSDDGYITIKLDSGYNIGINTEKISNFEVLQKDAASFTSQVKKSKAISFSGKVALLACGGTIVNKVDYRTGAVYPAKSVQEVLAGLHPSVVSSVAPKILFSIASEDMSPAHWVELAKEAAAAIKEGAQGVVITHGTDTMHYTSAALSFMLPSLPCPIVLTGSQRSSDRGSSDAPINLFCAISAAKADLSGVFICMHEGLSDEFCSLILGTKARKMHTSRRDAFRSINAPIAARISTETGKVERLNAKPRQNIPLQLDTRINTNVAIQYIYPGIKPSAISALSVYDGVVLVGMGLGHVPTNLGNDPLSIPIFNEVCQLIESGVHVYLASQCIYGRVNMDVYSNGRVLAEKGVMGNRCDMTPETAYVKLMWVLGHEKDPKKVKQLMESNLTGEISSRTEILQY
ncbi:MAG: Glu-tRNA(Gln) amidotransferase subunit GatD [Candidatus Anstonellaceae archaeon]